MSAGLDAYRVAFESMYWVAIQIVDKDTGTSCHNNLLAVCSAIEL